MSTKKPCDLHTHRPFRWLEGLLLVIVLCVSVLRLSFIETPQNTLQNIMLPTTPRGISLLLSAVIFVAAMLGLFLQILQGRWQARSGMMIGWIFFALAASISAYFGASDKRAAMTECFTLAVPMFTAVVIWGWLDSPRRVSVVLWFFLSIGCATVYTAMDQAMESNQKMVEDYQKDPQRHLQMLGIEPNSLGQFQYEHRIYSKDIRGFLITSNSTGTFLLAAVFITAGLLVDAVRHRKADPSFAARLLVLILLFVLLFAGFVVVKSRGAAAAFALSAVLFCGLIAFGWFFWPNRRLILIALFLAFIGVWIAAIAYGIKYGRLPGPNAMYVRWQYWVGAVQMAAEHPLGVGGGNFGTFYTQYKIPAAPETVSDPHNIVLSVLCQFGPLGLLGFVCMVFAALWKGLKGIFEQSQQADIHEKQDKIIAFGVLFGVMLSLLWLRPLVSEGGIFGQSELERQAAFIVIYLVPAFCFACPFGLLWAVGKELPVAAGRQGLLTGLLCAIVGILIHNLIDFALLEPGVWTMFWILIAVIISIRGSAKPSSPRLKFSWFALLSAAFIAAAGITLYLYVWIPVRAGVQFQAGLRNYDNAAEYFQQAAQIDPLDPEPWQYASRWSLDRFITEKKDEKYLEQASSFLQQAHIRDLSNYVHSKMLSEIYRLEMEAKPQNEQEFLNAAYEALLETQRLYPGSDRVAYDLGDLAEKLGKTDRAAVHYCRAVEIEDQYRRQFVDMYPGYPLCSRLGQQRYEHAKNYVLKSYSAQ